MDDDLLNKITYIAALVVFLIAGGICLYGTWIMSVRLGW